MPQRSPRTPPLPTWRPRRTVIDLYNEKDITPWYYRIIATLCAFMIMTSFLIFPTSMNSSVTISQTGALTAGILLLAPAFLASISVALLSKSWLFNLDILLIPCLSSSALGLINVIYTISIQKTLSWDLHLLLALVLSVVSLLTYGVATLLTYRKIYIVRMRDGMHRHQAPASASKFLPETELQRQQLLRLLLQQQEDPKATTVSPQLGSEQTYKLDWPENQERNARRGTWNSMRGNPFSRSRRNSYNHSVSGGGPAGGPAYPAFGGGAGGVPPIPSGNGVHAMDRGVPNIIVEEATLQDSVISPLDPIVYGSAMTQHEPEVDHGEEEDLADISGIVNTPYSQVTAANTQPLPQLESNGYPAEKPAVYNIPQDRRPDRPYNNYTVVDSTEVVRGPSHASNHDRNQNRESRRMEIELADRRRDGTRASRQELEDVEIAGSIRRVETDGWGRRF